MKKTVIIFIALVLLFLCSCSDQKDLVIENEPFSMYPGCIIALFDGKVYGMPKSAAVNTYQLASYDTKNSQISLLYSSDISSMDSRTAPVIGQNLYIARNTGDASGIVILCISPEMETINVVCTIDSEIMPFLKAAGNSLALMTSEHSDHYYTSIRLVDLDSGVSCPLITKMLNKSESEVDSVSELEGELIEMYDYDSTSKKFYLLVREFDFGDVNLYLEVYSQEGTFEKRYNTFRLFDSPDSQDSFQGYSQLIIFGTYVYAQTYSLTGTICRMDKDSLIPVLSTTTDYTSSNFAAEINIRPESDNGIKVFSDLDRAALYFFNYKNGDLFYLDLKSLYSIEQIGFVFRDRNELFFGTASGYETGEYTQEDWHYITLEKLMSNAHTVKLTPGSNNSFDLSAYYD